MNTSTFWRTVSGLMGKSSATAKTIDVKKSQCARSSGITTLSVLRRASKLSGARRPRARSNAPCVQANPPPARNCSTFVMPQPRTVAASPSIKSIWRASAWRDRKSTRLNSSHQIISYAVFCLKTKTGISAQPPIRGEARACSDRRLGRSTAIRCAYPARSESQIINAVTTAAPFFCNDTATTEIYTLSLHDALPICRNARRRHQLAAFPLHHVSAADADHRRRHDLLGVVHLHRLPADLGADPRRPGQCHPSDGD